MPLIATQTEIDCWMREKGSISYAILARARSICYPLACGMLSCLGCQIKTKRWSARYRVTYVAECELLKMDNKRINGHSNDAKTWMSRYYRDVLSLRPKTFSGVSFPHTKVDRWLKWKCCQKKGIGQFPKTQTNLDRNCAGNGQKFKRKVYFAIFWEKLKIPKLSTFSCPHKNVEKFLTTHRKLA